ncbi:hypothetical protein I350_03975 [Cryptococcus amylolentus CBS 6273]|uniref:Uncharacterized protein n=1 Tax=Cryptococcus amylolentus CBS 6273 TaxID=1296118 RepID=A0A1E3K0F5_9TREE|nr:hypothetical protein I350_03975 [Cryptococcus amylolentus CBS 6273]
MVAFGCVPLPRAQNPVVTTDEGEPLILPPLKFDGHKAAADRHSSQIFMADGDMVLARRLYHASYQVFHLEASQGTLDTLRAGTLLIKFASLLGYRLEASSLVSYITASGGKHHQDHESSRGDIEAQNVGWMAAMAHNIPAVIQESECTIQDPTLDLGTDESFPDFRSKEDRNQDSIAHLYSNLYRLVSRLRAENRTVEEAEEALSRFKQSIPKGYFVCSDQERIDQTTRIFVSTSFHYVRTTLHRGSLLLSVNPADGISEEELELRLRSRQACLESAVEEVRLRSKLGYSNDLHMMTSGAGINTASIIAVALYQNVRHPFMSSSEVLGTLRTYLEYESRRSFLSEVNQDQLEVVFDLAESVTQAMRDMSTREASDNDAGTTGSRRGNTQSTDTLPSQRSFQATQTDMRPRHERLYQPRLNLPPHSSQLPTTGASSSSDLSMLINPMESGIHQSPLSYAPSQHYRHDLSSVSGSSMIRSPAPAWASQQVMSGSSSSSTPAFPRDGSRGSSRGSNTPREVHIHTLQQLLGNHRQLLQVVGRATPGLRGLGEIPLSIHLTEVEGEKFGEREVERGRNEKVQVLLESVERDDHLQ